MIYRYILFCILAFVSSNILLGQTEDLPSEEVEILKEFDARLIDTEKHPFAPELSSDQFNKKAPIYNILTPPQQVDYEAPRIKPLAMKKERELSQYNFYAKAGAGIPKAVLGEIGYSTLINGEHPFGIDANYLQLNNDSNLENQRNSRFGLGINGGYLMPEGMGVYGDIGYQQRRYHYYGYEEADTTFLAEEVAQTYKNFDIGFLLKNASITPTGINYQIGIDFYSFNDDFVQDSFELKETSAKVYGQLSKAIDNENRISVDLGYQTIDNELNEKLDKFYFNPSYQGHRDNLQWRIGANVISDNSKWRLFPDLEATFQLSGTQFQVFAGATGDVHSYSSRNLTEYSPFIIANHETRNATDLDIYGGIKGNVSGFSYEAKAGYRKTNNLAVFLNDSLDVLNRLEVLYDTASIVYVSGTLETNFQNRLFLLSTLTFNNFMTDSLETAWHLPTFDLTFTTKYLMMDDRLSIKGQLFFQNGVPYLTEAGQKDNLAVLLDVSLGLEYQVSENIGIFADFNNITGNNRERWFNHPTIGTNIIGGVTARF